MDNQNRRTDDKRAPGQLQWGESVGAALAGAGFAATIASAPVLVPDIVIHGLRITKDGITYNGEVVNDAGTVHAALLAVLIGERKLAAPASADNPSHEEILSLHRQLASEKLRADQGWARAEAKSKECIELRERMAADNPSTAGAAPVRYEYRVNGYGNPTPWRETSKERCEEMKKSPQVEFEGEGVVYEVRALFAAPVAQSTAGADKIEEIRALLEEAHGFAAVSPRGKENINAALGLLDDLAAPAAQATTPTAAEVRDQALDVADVLRECADALAYVAFNYDGSKLDDLDPRIVESTGASTTALIAERRARNAIRSLRTASKEGGAA